MKKIKKHFLFLSLVLVSALPGFAADSEPSQSADDNVVVLTEAQYAAFTNDLGRIFSLVSNVVQAIDFQVSMIPHNTNSISNIQSSVSSLHSSFDQFMTLFNLSGSPTPKLSLSSLNNGGSISNPNQGLSNLGKALSMIANNVLGSVYAIRVFTAGNINSYDAGRYNFIELFKMVDELRLGVIALQDDFSDFRLEFNSQLDLTIGYLDNTYQFLVAQLSSMLDTLHTGTNQLQTIIYIIEGMTNRVENTDTNYYGDITNALNDIAAGVSSISSIIGDGWEPGGGSWPPGGGDGGSTNSVDLAYFDKWLKEWVDKYFYPADSTGVFRYDANTKTISFNELISNRFITFDVPLIYPGPHPFVHQDYIEIDSPEWRSGFYNTFNAYNSGHTNYYDIVSALLTDIQSVNSQNYSLFYMLATNILLSTGEHDTKEIEDDIATLQEKEQEAQAEIETLKSSLEYNFEQLKTTYEDIQTKTKAITSYLGTLSRLPSNDYYFNLPTFDIGESQYGGLQIVLPLTNSSFLMCCEVLRFFFICLLWALLLSIIYFTVKGTCKMFALLFKFFIFVIAIGTDK